MMVTYRKDISVGFSEQYGTYLAGPGIAEKGYLNVQVEVKAPGGHSSVPPAHTVRPLTCSTLIASWFTRIVEHRHSIRLARSP